MSPTQARSMIATILTAACLWVVPEPAWAQDACEALTQSAIQAVLVKIGESRAAAQLDASANGVTGTYAVAAIYNLAYLQDAETQFQYLESWLVSENLYTAFINNASAAYSVHGTVREVSYLLHHARHWASISAAYHTSAFAKNSIDRTSEALTLMDSLGGSAVACYIGFYGF